ncbi:MAG: uroporphyrinogen-III C-methyltransferase [Verrucomicrobia bacterium]|nr:uroporphyrinogen-III C-methyltransferase [Verrucomicrobiota bacterium]
MATKKGKQKRVESGVCYLVGAGPGDPGLITVRGRECIEIADVVIYDYLSNSELLTWAKPDAELVYAGKKAPAPKQGQDSINQMMIEKAKEGKTVTRLKGGDPLVFGRGGEEAMELKAAGVRFEIVPGISSVFAAPAYAGIPVTHRLYNSSLTIFTGHEDPSKESPAIDYKKIAEAEGTKVVLMGVENLGRICDKLIEHGAKADTPCALIRWGTTGGQETLTEPLNAIAAQAEKRQFRAPAVLVIGEVVNLRDELNWFEDRPLFGKRVIVTRTRRTAGKLSGKLRELGADIIEIPTTRIEKPREEMIFGEMVMDCHRYDWLIFSSPNGVERFFKIFYKLYKDAREIGAAKIAAIGPGTADKIKEYHLGVDLLPKKSVAESLAEAFEKMDESIENLTMLWVRPENARPVLAERLNAAGVILDEGIAYRTVSDTDDITGALEKFSQEGADIITFTSSSSVEGFLKLKLELPEQLKIVSIGPATSRTLKAAGLDVDIEAKEHNLDGLIAAVQKIAKK